MKIDITSMFFNSKIEGQTSTAAWGTSIGQNKSRDCRIDEFKPEIVDMVVGMTYKSISDFSNLDASKGSGDREILKCAVFTDIVINGKKIDNSQYVLLLVREHSMNHEGRLLISYAPYITYKGVSNQQCINLMREAIGCGPNGCWFVYSIDIEDQSQLHFNAAIVDPISPVIYDGKTKSHNRSEEWKRLAKAHNWKRPISTLCRTTDIDVVQEGYSYFLKYIIALLLKIDPEWKHIKADSANYEESRLGLSIGNCIIGHKSSTILAKDLDNCDTSVTWDFNRENYLLNKVVSGKSLLGLAKVFNTIYTDYRIDATADSNSNYIYSLVELEHEKTTKDVKLSHTFLLDSNSKFVHFVTAMMTKPFVLLAGVSGTGKSQIVRKLARATDDVDYFATDRQRWEKHHPENFEIVQVKPNWHNSLDLLGYKSNIGERPHYVTTPFIKFMVKAMLHPHTPFFLCLDEMNLAPVEEYFAEYLSAIESRSLEDGVYKTDAIIKPLKDFDEDIMTEEERVSTMMLDDLFRDLDDPYGLEDSIRKNLLEQGLMIPQNLIVFGTVNMDETTFSFSRKVLDRAMSIEMNEVIFDNFINGQDEEFPPVLSDLNGQIVYRQVKSFQCIEGNTPKGYQALSKEEAKKVVDFLNDVNNVLEGTPFKLGYRACNEALLYARANKEIVATGAESMEKTLDEFMMMKILSRIEGDDAKLRFEYQKGQHNEGEEMKAVNNPKFSECDTLLACLEKVVKDYVNLGESASLTKIEEMKRTLERDHFVSYWG